MKFSRMASLVCLLCLFPFSIPVQAADSLKISSTIGPVDAGILPLLADHVLREANHYIRILES